MIEVVVAGPEHLAHAPAISAAILLEVESGCIGMASRSPELIAQRMQDGEALIALEAGDWVGFCYLSPWEHGRFVSTSALIVRRECRGLGVARALKEKALWLANERYPLARPFGLSTSDAVARVNLSLGFREVAYCELPRDPAFWQGCESCPLHATLLERQGQSCHCRAMLRQVPSFTSSCAFRRQR